IGRSNFIGPREYCRPPVLYVCHRYKPIKRPCLPAHENAKVNQVQGNGPHQDGCSVVCSVTLSETRGGNSLERSKRRRVTFRAAAHNSDERAKSTLFGFALAPRHFAVEQSRQAIAIAPPVNIRGDLAAWVLQHVPWIPAYQHRCSRYTRAGAQRSQTRRHLS